MPLRQQLGPTLRDVRALDPCPCEEAQRGWQRSTENMAKNAAKSAATRGERDMGKTKGDSSLAARPQTGRAPDGATRRQTCIDAAGGDDLTFLDGHDDAIIGVAERDGESCVVYDRAKIIRTLRRRDGMDMAGASEFFEYNIAGAWIGVASPIFATRP